MAGLSRREQLKLANQKKVEKETAPSIVDDVINEDSKNDTSIKTNEPKKDPEIIPEIAAPVHDANPAKKDTNEISVPKTSEKPDIITIKPPVKKQTKSIRKCFLITPEMDDKLKKMALDYDTSENEIINQILSQVLR